MFVSIPPHVAISNLMQRAKGRSSYKIQIMGRLAMEGAFRFVAGSLIGVAILSPSALAGSSIDALIGDWARILELQSINQTEAILAQGSLPTNWPNRTFIPQSTITSAVKLIEGGAIRIPIGAPRNERVDGYGVIGISKTQLMTREAGLRVRLTVVAAYEPDLLTTPWSNTRISFDIDAALLPSSQEVVNNNLITYVKVLPHSIGNINVPVNDLGTVDGLLSQLDSVSALNALTERLQIPIPIPKMTVDLSMDSDMDAPMKDGDGNPSGNAKLHFSMKRKPQSLEVLDRIVIASNGIWLLGGLPPKPIPINPLAGPAPSEASLNLARSKLASQLAPFKNTISSVAITASASDLTNLANRLVADPFDIDITTKESEGSIASASLVTDNVLGVVGYSVTPNGASFLRGHIVGSFAPVAWKPSLGFILKAKAAARSVSAEAVVHLKAGRVDEDVTKSIQLKDHGAVDISLRLAVEEHDLKITVPFQNVLMTVTDKVVVFQPHLDCTKASFDFVPSDNITSRFATVSPIGFRIIQGLGGKQIPPSVLLDNLPIVIDAPDEKDKNGKLILRLPNRPVFSFKHPYFQALFDPELVSMASRDITLRSALTLTPRDQPATDMEKAAHAVVLGRLIDEMPTCDTTLQLWMTGGGINILNITQVLKFLVDSQAAGKKIVDNAWAAARKLTGATPRQIIKAAPSVVGTQIDDWKKAIATLGNAPAPHNPVDDICAHNRCPPHPDPDPRHWHL